MDVIQPLKDWGRNIASSFFNLLNNSRDLYYSNDCAIKRHPCFNSHKKIEYESQAGYSHKLKDQI